MLFASALLVLATLDGASAAVAPDAATGEPQVKALVLDFEATGDVKEEAVQVGEIVASIFSNRDGIEVLTGRDVRSMMELEVERQETGCDTSCLSEIAGAMGAQIVVNGSVGRLGTTIIVTVNVFDSKNARSLGRKTIRASKLEELPALLEDAVGTLAGNLMEEKSEPTQVALPPLLLSPLFLGGAGAIGVGTIATGIAVVFVVISDGQMNDKDATDKDASLFVGRLALVGAAVSVAAVGVGVGLMAMAGAQE